LTRRLLGSDTRADNVFESPVFHVELREPKNDVDRLHKFRTRLPHLLAAISAFRGKRMHEPVVGDGQRRSHGHGDISLRWSMTWIDPKSGYRHDLCALDGLGPARGALMNLRPGALGRPGAMHQHNTTSHLPPRRTCRFGKGSLSQFQI